MRLAEYERALARVCLAASPSEEDLAALGGPRERWLRYRSMVRNRLRDFVAAALPRTRVALGAEAFDALVDAFLAHAPPRARFVREVTVEFVGFALPRLREAQAPPPWAADLLAFEGAKFETAWLDAGVEAGAVGEFAMERPAVLSATHRRLRVRWDVHRADAVEPATGAWSLLLHRDAATHRVEVLALSETAADLVERMARGEGTTIECVRAVVAAHGGEPDGAFLASVAQLLAELTDRGVLLGSPR